MLKVIVLTADYNNNAARIIEYLTQSLMNRIIIVGIIYDEGKQSDRKRQFRRIKVWYKQGGIWYVVWRICLNYKLRTLVHKNQIHYAKNLDDLSRLYKISLFRVPNVNSDYSEKIIKSLSPNLGLSLGNRIIKERIFSIPSLGVINLHHGKIPFYRGGPPGFWEIYNDEDYMGVSVHRIDSKIDHGALLTQEQVRIGEHDDTKTLFEKALSIDYKLVEEALDMFCSGNIRTIPVEFSLGRVYSYPSYSQVRKLEKRKGKRINPLGYRNAQIDKIPV